MRILHVSELYGNVTTTFIRNEVEHFRKTDDLLFLCMQRVGEAKEFIKEIPFQQNGLVKKLRWWLWRFDIRCDFKNRRYASKVRTLLDEFRPDIIHCHFGYEALMLLDNIDIRRYPIIIHFHGYDASMMLKKKSYVKKLKSVLKNKNVFPVTVSDFFINQLSETLDVPKNRFTLLRYGVNLELFNPYQKNDNGRVFLQVSSLVPKKGHEFTLKAFSLFLKNREDKEYTLILTGDGKRRALLESLASEYGISDKVQFVGNVAPSDAVNLMSTADCFVHHSITTEEGDTEGIPNAIMEAMAMELPIVSTFHAGIPELVEDGVNGYLVEERDVAAYAKKMEEALKMGRLKVNREKIEAIYNREKHNQQLRSIYEKIIKNVQ